MALIKEGMCDDFVYKSDSCLKLQINNRGIQAETYTVLYLSFDEPLSIIKKHQVIKLDS